MSSGKKPETKELSAKERAKKLQEVTNRGDSGILAFMEAGRMAEQEAIIAEVIAQPEEWGAIRAYLKAQKKKKRNPVADSGDVARPIPGTQQPSQPEESAGREEDDLEEDEEERSEEED